MKDAVKFNIDTIKASQMDEEWARNFLYPDLRKAYKLQPNEQNFVHAVDLVARARAASLKEFAKTQTFRKNASYDKSYAVNVKDESYAINVKPMTEDQKSKLKEASSEIEKIFDSVRSVFKKLRF